MQSTFVSDNHHTLGPYFNASARRYGDMLLMRGTSFLEGVAGIGNFGTVVRAEDNVTGTLVAIKLLHVCEDRNPDPLVEERMYEKLLSGCNPHIDLFAAVLGSGDHQGFHCIVFELCQGTLFDIIRGDINVLPLPARHLIEIAYQLVKAVEYLHSLGIAHTDIKPDNIALRCQDIATIHWLEPVTGFHEKRILVCPQICVIDLGKAVDVRGVAQFGRIGVQGYRAPEVVMGLPWSYGVDSFAIGCTIGELYTMTAIFEPDIEGDREYLAAIDRVLGPFPTGYATALEAKYPGTFCVAERVSVKYPPTLDGIPRSEDADAMRRLERIRPIHAHIHEPDLCDLLCRLMAVDPGERGRLEDLGKHKYFDALRKLQLQ
ncbi:kinase-like protein [Trametes sanguinea]|nr:kinase-like protein [Trametes sanguinea]